MRVVTRDEELAQPALVYETLESEIGGLRVYRTALTCVRDAGLKSDWQAALGRADEHVRTLRELCPAWGLEPDCETPERMAVRLIGQCLIKAMHLSLGGGSSSTSQRVAAHCVASAESRGHLQWELLENMAATLRVSEAQRRLADLCHAAREAKRAQACRSLTWGHRARLAAAG